MAMTKLYECGKCGVVSKEQNHLCSPVSFDTMDSYCGASSDTSSMCDSIREKAEFTCTTCGRTAESPDLICSSIRLH